MSTTGNIDGCIEIVLKINDTTGEIEEVVTKTMNGELIDPTKLEDLEWWADKIATYGDMWVTYKLESANNTVNYSNLTQFLTGDKSQATLNNKLADLAASNKDYSKWIENYGALYQGANDLVALSEDAMKISEAVNVLCDNNISASDRGRAIKEISTGIFGMGSTLSGHLPGITGELISTQLETAVSVLEDGSNVLINYIERLENLERDIEAIVNGNKETVEGMEAINEVAEAFSSLIPGGASSIKGLSEYNDILNRYEKAVYNYEKKYDRDIDGDGDICNGDSYDPDNPGGGDGGGGTADDQFKGGEKQRVDPLVLDLNNNGFNPSNLANGAYFDLDCNGMAERINWVQDDDSLLAYDRNEDGIINDGSELFGDNTILANGEKAVNGFYALKELDTNEDGIIDKSDADFSKLLVWKDINGNGISENGELVGLSDLSIKEIRLNYKNLNTNTESGAVLGNVSTFVYTDGNESEIAEYWVLSQKFNTVDKNPIDIPDDIAVLPNIKSMGNAYSLHSVDRN